MHLDFTGLRKPTSSCPLNDLYLPKEIKGKRVFGIYPPGTPGLIPFTPITTELVDGNVIVLSVGFCNAISVS